MKPVKERPILFSAPMVRAILAGEKTVTRRVAKPRKWPSLLDESWSDGYVLDEGNREWLMRDNPYGQPGDRLWVRETWGVISHDFDEHGNMVDWAPDRPAQEIREMRFGRGYYTGHVIYAADGPAEWAGDDDGGGEPRSAWHPSIHMPRIASRILLEITDVRVERLQDISEEQAEAEGVGFLRAAPDFDETLTAKQLFEILWDHINGEGAWKANPWVWCVSFRRVEQ
ncbi:hypothetical protein [Pseudomonas typographi]|uniref:hypothetical protein n=1 Tax=Pseudomonas typographi TaxID=2715964 RepID=UPI0016865E42|nr:hypothetical protein [Pseudomonas typographi]MBD1590297.1 hypothetical protein [Pseudomonas typographi]